MDDSSINSRSESPEAAGDSRDQKKSWFMLIGPVLFVILLIISAIVFGIENLLQFIGIK